MNLMSDLHVAPSPENFKLFYAYFAGENPEVSAVIGDMVAGRRPFSPATLIELRLRFFADQRHDREAAEIGAKISGTLDSVMSRLQDAGKDTEAYGRTLSAASGELDGDHSPASVRKLVEGLITATKTMETRANVLETELQHSSHQVHELRSKLEVVRRESLTDSLTGIANRKAFDAELQKTLESAADSGRPVSLLMCDIDRFKNFNDTWGHQTGDQVLRLVANCLSENVKGRDTAARYGGEEFGVILPETALDVAVTLANQIRAAVEGKKLIKKSTGDILGTITISVGVACFNPKDNSVSLVQRADSCLYAAKGAGRNCVISERQLQASAAA
jgi:diguanylate cyclase